ncbi:succinylglutamate desuccinylase/aspartoacylase family protein [Candidatus Coxiella mudrowiae]|uniref:succinylglutamate desuccinylase/aspartoacylase family protein n=1 Tax=Candidatus Coxiella mudrowiae TaxID=2054173 RepID=UPI0027D30CA9|nr:succinylglutamate desuccinylase/aspartoacylase family protein [Candidatus Coxiella mudrowiae]
MVSHYTHGINLHSASIHRRNLPQIRINLAQASKEKLTRTFSASVILNSNFRDKSLRQAANEMDIPVLVYEGGEAFRFNEAPIRFGIQGILRVMHELGILPAPPKQKITLPPLLL